jgi:uncharacterized membrane protein YhaH (DUF805 family)
MVGGEVMIFLARFVGLNRRIGRLHYWALLLVAVIIVFLAATVGSLNLQSQPVQWLSYGILISSGWPVLSATKRRLHDADLSWWYAVLFIALPIALQLSTLLFSSLVFEMDIASAILTIAGFALLGLIPGSR